MARYPVALVLVAACFATGCASPPQRPPDDRPSVAPATQPTAALSLEGSAIQPMYREMLAVDLPTIARVAKARGLDIQEARQRAKAYEGRYESSVEAVFPVIAPAFTYQHVEGANQNANGTLVLTNFNNILPAITVQWIVNPGRVVYDIVASKRRLEAARQQEAASELDTLRAAAVQYYEIVLAQAKVAVARQAVAQAEEALRLTSRRVRTGNALAADESRARASLAGRRQDLLVAVNDFYQASVALSVTLDMDPTVTLVPASGQIAQISLVREDLPVEQMLAMAVKFRPDLAVARSLVAAARADKGAVSWGALGPQLQAAYTFGGIQTGLHGNTSALYEQQRASAGAGFALGPSTFGQLKTAEADFRTAAVRVERQLDAVRAQVVAAQQTSATNAALLPVAREQVAAAEEALRLAQSNLRAGTMLLIDVLQAEDELNSARLRYALAVAHYNQSQVNLLAALGMLDQGSLEMLAAGEPATRPAEDRGDVIPR